MDKVTKYKKLVKEIIDTYEYPDKNVESLLVKDMDGGHFLVFRDGWIEDAKRTYGFSIHLQVTDNGKIWVRQDTTTDPPVTQKLLDKGVPKKDIVLAFHAPIVRPDTGFAIA